MTEGKATFLPCAYGYATTIRKVQGASLDAVVLYFDHCYPAERGYGYVGASRFRSAEGLWLFGKIRRSDWLPVTFGTVTNERETRSALSRSSSSDIGGDNESDSDRTDSEPDEWDEEMEDAYATDDSDYERDEEDENEGYEEPDPEDFEDRDWKSLLQSKNAMDDNDDMQLCLSDTDDDKPEDKEESDNEIPLIYDLLKTISDNDVNPDMPE